MAVLLELKSFPLLFEPRDVINISKFFLNPKTYIKRTVQVYEGFLQGTVIQRCASISFVESFLQLSEIYKAQCNVFLLRMCERLILFNIRSN